MELHLAEKILEGAFAFASGSISTYLGIRWSSKKKLVRINIYQKSLVDSEFAQNQFAAIMVDRSQISAIGERIDEKIKVNDLKNFTIVIENVGNEPIETPVISVELCEGAVILQYKTTPASTPGYEILSEPRLGNCIDLTPKYLNQNEKFKVQITATNILSEHCDVKVFGIGVQEVRD